MHNVIDGPMVVVASFAVPAAESMGSQVVHFSSTVAGKHGDDIG